MDFNNFFKEVKNDMLDLVKERFGQEGEKIKEDVGVFLDNSREKLERWASLMAQGAITPAELEVLLQSQKDILIMESLYKAGISNIRIGLFKNAAIKLVVDKAVQLVQ
ncbi:MAG: hypothetical protein CL868_14915 [Cytophagaceae bacterium]|nr:hypothetical protein [Cytophagaceae bacterium]|tara:strand:+ start:301 stop:624 length:324 start_codon:yes stop_codon:yes gene_type:complete